ncbi:hypothetical protein IHQ71_28255 [Rhizobium sp. TH2]|uniref:hypothetical protein n=1 Tax=Rhizobium sp. TH2 TaxID=2775403 RepID=UPI0021578CD8|nr:hypothetical protein [Rhizobium sp. TH2]UVC08961.1 hypothetical protein IHQ71_28255 [Rhizobium sp. TH2]
MTATSRETIRDIVRNKGPLVVFALLTFGGMAFIWTAKLFEWDTVFVTALPIALMLTYFTIAFVAQGLRLHNEQAGDNLYYMGFLFTLSSLGVSLYRFAGDVSIEDIVQNFGIAVTSTIVGITLRILFNQMRRDPLDIERQARTELSDMARKVRAEFDSSAREFSTYRRTSNQMLSEGFGEIAEQAEKNGEAILKMLEMLSTESVKPIQEAATKMASILDATNKVLEERTRATAYLAETASEKLESASDKLSGILVKFGERVDAIGTKLDEMQLPSEVIKLEMRPVLTVIKELGAVQSQRLSEAAESNRVQTEKLTAVLEPLNLLPERLEASTKLLAGLPGHLETQLRPLGLIPDRIMASTEPLAQMSENIGRTLASIEVTVSSMDDAVTRLDLLVNDVGRNVGDLANHIAELKRPAPEMLPEPVLSDFAFNEVADGRTTLLDRIIDAADGPGSITSQPATIDGETVDHLPEVATIGPPGGGNGETEPKKGWFKWRE